MTPIGNPPAQTAQPDLLTLPRRVDRKTGAALVTLYYFPVTPRSLEEPRKHRIQNPTKGANDG